MGLAPQNRVDHTPEVILSFDDAWDHDLVDYELDVIRGERTADDDRPVQWTVIDDHPWVRYHHGVTRCDLALVRQYLRKDAPSPPVKFTLRRLTLRELTIVRDIEADAPGSARMAALRAALVSVEGDTIKFNRGARERGDLDDGDLERLRALVSDKGFDQLGTLAVLVSQELLEEEKKP